MKEISQVDFKVLDLPRASFGGGFRDHVEPALYRTAQLCTSAQIAVEIAKQLGIVACIQDGEDSTGRQKLRLLSPEEVADRAASIAHNLWCEFKRREWLVAVPEPRLREKAEERAET